MTHQHQKQRSKLFLWCYVKHINLSNKHSREIKKFNKTIAEKLVYDGIEFPVKEKDFDKIEIKNNIRINEFSYGNGLVFPNFLSNKKFVDSMDLLLLIDDDKSHYVYIKDFNRFMFHKTKNNKQKMVLQELFAVF